MSKPPIPPWTGTVTAGTTVRTPAFSLVGKSTVRIDVKASEDLTAWLEHGRAADIAGALPWGTEAVAVDNAYNTQGGGQAIFFDVPAGSEQGQICLHNAGLSDATGGRVDVGVQ